MADRLPSATAVMPALDDAGYIGSAIDSILGQRYEGTLDLVVGVGPSTDGTEELVRGLADSHDRLRVVDNPTGRTSTALNAAVGAATGDVIVRVDAHCELPPDYVARAVDTLERTGSANVGGVQRAVGRTPLQRAVAAAMSSRFGVGDAKFHYGGSAGPTDTVYLGVFRAGALREVGGFDETLVRNQDYELNVRLRAAGHIVWFDPDLEVRYHPRHTLGRLARQYFDYGRWKREVISRHPRSTRARQLVPPVTVIGIAAGVTLAVTGRRWGLAAPAVYGAAVLAASAITPVAEQGDRRYLPAVFPTMHLAWGAGFLAGPPRGATTPVAATARLATT